MDPAWLSELEMAWNEEPMLNDHQNKEINSLGEELALVLGDDLSPISEDNTISSLLDYYTSQNPTNLLDELIPNVDNQIPPFFNDECSPKSREPIVIQHSQNEQQLNDDDENGSKELSDDQQSTKGGKRKRRDPEQIQGHIMAERKRRQTLTQRFIALSALVPGLKKVDKTSILEEAIKHLKQMQEKVKTLEEVVSKQAVRPTMLVKRTQLVVDDSDSDNSSIDNTNTCICHDTRDGDQSATLPEIQIKVSHKTMLLKICCVKRKGILGNIYNDVEKYHFTILNCNVIAFESSALDITIVAQMEATEGYEKHVKDLVRNLNSTLRSS
ncbi:hypothetical protein RND81_13G196400 [Saponaria officinalis]|uniref:BHLH domain-containing protein n=1 Tax=Saponaria officinalis TaxID=3572 RepID=A0AAW1H5D5_SAPOF